MNSFIIIYLLILYYINNTIGTNLLPLEVFEISSAAVVQQQQQQQQKQSHSNNNKILNSDNINKYNISNNNINNNNDNNNINSNINYINNNTKINNNNIINKNNSNNSINNNLFKRIYTTNNINSNILPFISNQIKLEQNKNNINNINNNNINNKNRRSSRQMTSITKDNLLNDELLMPHRILYQVGESEEDLPLCAPNAVCSKIDVYDIPWIERQCRCPTVYTNKIHIHHHHHHHHHNNPSITNSNTIKQIKHNNGKLSHNTPQKYNNIQQQQRHFYDINNRKIEDIHIKKFMQKLQSVHREDLILSENDLQTSNEQIQKNSLNLLISSEQQQQLQQNKEQPLKQQQNLFILRKIFRQVPLATKAAGSYIIKSRDTNKLRHSGHLGHHQHHHHNHPHREISFLGGCPNDIRTDDGFTISDKTRHYKLCNPVHKLPLCNSFTDFTWTVTTMPELNVTEQIVHCRCRPNSVTYLTKWEPNTHSGYTYYFACSPQNRLRCQRKEPCRLFTVRQRQEHLDEVNTNPLCQCPRDHKCPVHHTDSGVMAGESYMDDNIKTYAGYCMAND